MTVAMQILINGLILGSVYALVALGFQLIYSIGKFFHIAHAAVYVAAGYGFLLASNVLASFHNPMTWWSWGVSGAVGVGLSIVLMAVSERAVYSPLLKAKAPSLVVFITSLGVYLVVVNVIELFWGSETHTIDTGLRGFQNLHGIVITEVQLLQLLISSLSVGLTLLFLNWTTVGKRIRAVADNPVLASTLGIGIRGTRLRVFLLGSGICGIASVLTSIDVGLNPHVGLPIVFVATAAVIVGGIESSTGAVFGAFCLSCAQSLATWALSSEWKDAVTFVFLMIVLSWRAQGLLTKPLRIEER